MHGYCTIGFFESDDLVTWQRMALLATYKVYLALLVEETVYVRLGFEGRNGFEPVPLWSHIRVGADHHHIAIIKFGLHRFKLSVYTCILGMKSQFAVYLECKVKRCSSLGQKDTLAVGGISDNIVIIER